MPQTMQWSASRRKLYLFFEHCASYIYMGGVYGSRGHTFCKFVLLFRYIKKLSVWFIFYRTHCWITFSNWIYHVCQISSLSKLNSQLTTKYKIFSKRNSVLLACMTSIKYLIRQWASQNINHTKEFYNVYKPPEWGQSA